MNAPLYRLEIKTNGRWVAPYDWRLDIREIYQQRKAAHSAAYETRIIERIERELSATRLLKVIRAA